MCTRPKVLFLLLAVSAVFHSLYSLYSVRSFRTPWDDRETDSVCMRRRRSLAVCTPSNKNPVYRIMHRLLVDPLQVCFFFLWFSFLIYPPPSYYPSASSVILFFFHSSPSSSPSLSPPPTPPLSALFPSVFPAIRLSRGSEWCGSFPYSVLNVCWW